MRPIARLAVATLLAVPASAAPALAAEVPPAPHCAEPVAVMDYDADALTYSMEIDLSGCDWWTGNSIELSGTVERSFAGLSEGVGVGSGCAEAGAEPAGESEPADAPEPIHTCDIEIVLEHPSTELARYQGEITHPGPNGEETQRFAAWCGTVAGVSGCLPEE